MKAASAWVAWSFAVVACPGICGAEVDSGGAERTSRTLAPYFFVENCLCIRSALIGIHTSHHCSDDFAPGTR